jgi:transglutaminase-like putative cysteine protease
MIRIVVIKKILLYILFFSYFTPCFGSLQEEEGFISLIQDTDAIVLQDDLSVTILNENSIEYTVHVKILIKNIRAEEYCTVVINESEYQVIQNIDAIITDTLGNFIKQLDSDEIEEAEMSPGYVLYSGKKYSWFSLTHHTYPYVIDYTYTMELESLFFWPDWYPQSDIPCLSSTYKLQIPNGIEFEYFNVGINIEPDKIIGNSKIIYSWQLINIPPRSVEDFMPPENKKQMAVHFKPKKFEISEYNGSFESWSSLADWYRALTDGKYKLSKSAQDEFQELVAGIEDPKEKVEILYKYLQQKNRYVAIELGIGGWQPQSASDVYENRYGDCKDLTTVMVSMLDVVGIKSYPALALTRDKGEVMDDFPSNQFNHCIAFVPLEKDTIWLECTSSYIDMEDTPYNIEDIFVLVVKDDDGELIKTPKKNSANNHWISSLNGVLGKQGDLTFNVSVNTSGNQKNYFKSKLAVNSKQDDLIFLQNYLGRNYSNLNINDFTIEVPEDNTLEYNLELNGVYKKFNPKRGSRIFINPNILNRLTGKSLPAEDIDERKYPIFYKYPYIDIDTVMIEISKRYILESKPKDVSVSNSFAQFSAEYKFNNNKLYYLRKMEIKDNIIAVELYPEYIEFLKKVIKSDKSKFVFKRK